MLTILAIVSLTSCLSKHTISKNNECFVIDKPFLFDDEVAIEHLSSEQKRDYVKRNMFYCKRCGDWDANYKDYCDSIK
jgi:hypothetical protein